MFIKIYDESPNVSDVSSVVACIDKGGIVILPTDTIYSMVCKLSSKKGFDTLCRIKGLTAKNADFSILCASISELSSYTRPINNVVFRMLKKNLPGPFTFIFEASSKIPKLFGNKRKTIGIRVPDNAIFQAISQRLDEPLIGTSIHDDDAIIEYTTDPELIYEKYESQIDMMVNGGFGNNVASTVVDCTEQPPIILRQGIGQLEL